MGAPQPTDQFTRFMASMFTYPVGITTLWQSLFGRKETMSETIYSPDANTVEIEIQRLTQKVGALVRRGTDSRNLGGKQKNLTAENWSVFAREYPLGEDMSDIQASKLTERIPGELSFSSKTRFDRARYYAVKFYLEHTRKFLRLFEILAGSAILTGQHPAIIGTTNSDLIYDFLRNPAHFITVANPWNTVSADIYGDIDAGWDLIRNNAGVSADYMVVADDVMDSILKDATVLAFGDSRRINLIEIGDNVKVPSQFSHMIAAGAVCCGKIRTTKFHEFYLFTYTGRYQDDDLDFQKFMPDGMALMGFSGARCDRYFGPPEMLPQTSDRARWFQEMFGFNMMAPPQPLNIKNSSAILTPGMFYTDAYSSKDYKKVTIRTQVAPIFATTMTDAFVTFSGLIEADES